MKIIKGLPQCKQGVVKSEATAANAARFQSHEEKAVTCYV
jgi:hypothetical protein